MALVLTLAAASTALIYGTAAGAATVSPAAVSPAAATAIAQRLAALEALPGATGDCAAVQAEAAQLAREGHTGAACIEQAPPSQLTRSRPPLS